MAVVRVCRVCLANCYFSDDSLEPCPATILGCAIRPFFSLRKDQLLNADHFRHRCMNALPDTPSSLYCSNRLCFIG